MKFFKNEVREQQADVNQVRRFSLGQYIAAVSVMLLSVTALSYAAGILTLNRFQPTTVISAQSVNDNFDYVQEKLNVATASMVSMQTTMVNMQATISTFTGTPAAAPAGSVVQMKSIQTRAQGVYAVPVVALTGGLPGIEITPLNIVITPLKAGNAMVLEWHVNGEAQTDAVYIVQRNGAPLPDTTDTSNYRWAGLAGQPYDVDNNSTPSNTILRITDYNTLATSSTYTLHIRSSNGGAATLNLNRTFGSSGQDAHEASLSSGTATEIAQ